MSRFRPAGFRNGRTAWRRASRPDSGRPARRRSTAFRDGWTAWRRRASRNPAAPRNAVSPWEAGAPRSAASRWEAAANPWLGAIARCSRTGSSNPSPSSGESCELSVPLSIPASAAACTRACRLNRNRLPPRRQSQPTDRRPACRLTPSDCSTLLAYDSPG